jgi:Dyp-type peroxidase family
MRIRRRFFNAGLPRLRAAGPGGYRVPVDLSNPVDVTSPEWQEALEMMQGNVLKSHGRDYSALLLIQFGPGADLRSRVREFGLEWITTAREQERQASNHRRQGANPPSPDRQLFGNLSISVWGYLALGYSQTDLIEAFPHPQNDAGALTDPSFTNWFLHGMAYHGGDLCDPPRLWWEAEYRGRIDGLLLLACDDQGTLNAAVVEAVAHIGRFGCVRRIEPGTAHRRDGVTVEHFGFADGISQPRFFKDDPELEPPRSALHEDRLAGEPGALGSYLVYRKLEQNVRLFRREEERLANLLGLTGAGRERAGAMIVGRFRDGSPLCKAQQPGWQPALDNDFDYLAEGDKDGVRCPLHAHIRKVRPRTIGRPRMVRRGVPYGPYDPTGPNMTPPETGSGLLFLSFQRNIRVQFGLVQQQWANDVNFPDPGTGQDPLIGQGLSSVDQQWRTAWGGAATQPLRIARFVTLKGGEFFFAPSLPFFRKLGRC